MISNGLTINDSIQAKVIQESNEYAPHNLVVGSTYEVEEISMGQSYTTITINGKRYKSVCFEFYEKGNKINIYRDKRFNPYMGLFH